MAGRWQLAAAGASQCVMNFGATPDAGEGTIAPEGGCPGNFFTSRKWTFEQGSLVIRDHNGQPLGQLALASPGRFDGKAANGQQVTLHAVIGSRSLIREVDRCSLLNRVCCGATWFSVRTHKLSASSKKVRCSAHWSGAPPCWSILATGAKGQP